MFKINKMIVWKNFFLFISDWREIKLKLVKYNFKCYKNIC